MLSEYLPTIVIMFLGGLGLWQIYWSQKRSASDVIGDLHSLSDDLRGGGYGASRPSAAPTVRRLGISDRLGKIGLFERNERQRFEMITRLMPIIVSLIVVFVAGGLAGVRGLPLILFGGAGLCLGYLLGQRRYRVGEERFIRGLEFHLPLVMENLVMAVQAGLDIIAALKSVLDQGARRPGAQARDPVSRLLVIVVELTEAGIGFDDALKEIAGSVDCPALRHAFVHLGMAYREGGELVMPLRELSNATQLYYQETLEESIAKMPIKATMPLLMTFAGLMIFFITSPLIQILGVMDRVNLGGITPP